MKQRIGQGALLILLVVLGVLYARSLHITKTLNEGSQRAQAALLNSSGHGAIEYTFSSSAKDPMSLSVLADVLDLELSRSEALISLNRRNIAPAAYTKYSALPQPQQATALLRVLANKEDLTEADRKRIEEIVQAWNEYQFNTRLSNTRSFVRDPTNLTYEYSRLFLRLRAVGAEVFRP